jgi:hypothetical protein
VEIYAVKVSPITYVSFGMSIYALAVYLPPNPRNPVVIDIGI